MDDVRVLALMGSGETSPTMAGTHRRLARELEAALGSAGKTSGILLETPYGFQENAADISAKAVKYFANCADLSVEVRGRATDGDEADAAAIRAADWVFSGPGSPSYALQYWRDRPIGNALRYRVRDGSGFTVLASAAAATCGAFAVPVYEVYKVGATPHWLEGFDLMGELGMNVAVIPHYDNTEGGTHDTRFCYLGERRLRMLEAELPDDAAVLGIDEHTAVIIYLTERCVEVVGRGGITLRQKGESVVIPSGTRLGLDDFRRIDALFSSRGTTKSPASRPPGQESPGVPSAAAKPEDAVASFDVLPLKDITAICQRSFEDAHRSKDAKAMVKAILDLENAIRAWASDTEEDEGTTQAAEVMRGLVIRLGDAAVEGLKDPRLVFAPIVEPLLSVRQKIRKEGHFDVADAIRDALTGAGLEVHDTDQGPTWEVTEASS